MLRFRQIIVVAEILLAALFSTALWAGHPPYAVGLLEGTGSRLNRQVMVLIANKDYKQLKELAAQGVKFNVADNKGVEPVHYAGFMGSVEAMRFFHEHGASLRATTFGGWTALHYAGLGGHSEVAGFLVNAGVPIDIVDTGGESPLFYAIESGNLAMVQWLVEHGANINHENNQGDTPLAVAIENHHEPIKEYLIRRGARVSKN